MNNCAKCQSGKIIPDVRISDRRGYRISLGVNVYEHPEKLIFKGTHTDALRWQVCGECGYLESYVENPQELYAVYLATQQEDREQG